MIIIINMQLALSRMRREVEAIKHIFIVKIISNTNMIIILTTNLWCVYLYLHFTHA